MARAATSPELALFRTPGQWSELRAAIFSPTTVYSARINQTFSTFDGVLEITYDGPSGTLADVLQDMTVFVGSSAGGWDKGICRVRSIDATKVYISQTADIEFVNDLHLTVVNDFGLWAKHVIIDDGVAYMDGGIAYSDQHTNMDPVPIMGGNRVLKLTGATVSTTYDFSLSYMPDGSAIAEYLTTSPTASGGSDLDTDTPTLEWDTVGWHLVYLTLTGENGAVFFGVRYVYIWDDAHQPARAVIGPNGQDVDSGGWEFSLTLFDNCNLNDVRDHALVILFAEDHYGDTTQSIGPLAGCENVVLTGWIAREQINMNPEQGLVEFTAYTAQYWFQQISSYPDGVEFTTGAPSDWTKMQNLTVDLGVWHHLHWRSTATRVMDVFLTGDTKYTSEVSSLASNLWDQLREMTFDQIFARAGVDEYNRLFVQVHPQLIPSAERSGIPVVMDITKPDRTDELIFDRVTMPEVSTVTGNGVSVNSAGLGTPYFSIAPGRTYPRYGRPEPLDNLLVESQLQCNTFFGLYRSWRNNQLPEIPVPMIANNRLIGCFPNQYASITIDAADNPRGVAYSGKLIPTSKQYVFDAETGYLHAELVFEAETLESLAVTGDIPGSDDRSVPPIPGLPPLPPFPPIIPGEPPPSPNANGPSKVVVHDAGHGWIYTENFNESSPNWNGMNAGLTPTQATDANLFFKTPNGACYCGKVGTAAFGATGSIFLARASSVGATWVILYDENNMGGAGERWGVHGAGFNPLKPEEVGILLQTAADGGPYFWIGANTAFSQGVLVIADDYFWAIDVSYGYGKWMASSYNYIGLISPNGASLSASSPDVDLNPNHIRASTTGRTFHNRVAGKLFIGENNFATHTEYDGAADVGLFTDASPGPAARFATDPTGMLCMAPYDTGLRGKSGDGGHTWATLPNLPYGGEYTFEYAGKGGSLASQSRWIAARGVIRLTLDWGASWLNREGDITSIAPIPDINMVRVLEY